MAHRLSTIRQASKICVFSEGRIVEQGSHDELMEVRGHYYHLVQAQTSNDGAESMYFLFSLPCLYIPHYVEDGGQYDGRSLGRIGHLRHWTGPLLEAG